MSNTFLRIQVSQMFCFIHLLFAEKKTELLICKCINL